MFAGPVLGGISASGDTYISGLFLRPEGFSADVGLSGTFPEC